MCCLMYEHKTYVEARRRFPREGRTLRTSRGEEKVVSVDIWRDTVSLRAEDGERRLLTLEELKAEVGRPRDTRSRPGTEKDPA
jgi:cell fate regulator YaaT (PSP1 superfamily)